MPTDVNKALETKLKTDVFVWLIVNCEVIVCIDKDPPQFNGKIKSLINEKLRTYNAYPKNIANSQLRKNLSSLQQWLRDLIDDSKQKYFLSLTQKLNTIQKSIKAYWALLKFF